MKMSSDKFRCGFALHCTFFSAVALRSHKSFVSDLRKEERVKYTKKTYLNNGIIALGARWKTIGIHASNLARFYFSSLSGFYGIAYVGLCCFYLIIFHP